MMDEQEYLHEILRTTTAGKMSRSERLALCGLGIAGEAGEVADLVKKHLFLDRPLSSAQVKEELGDVLWYLTLLAYEYGCTLEDVMTANVMKLRARYPNGYDPDRSRQREEESV